MFSIFIFNKALKLHFKKIKPRTTNNNNSSHAFSFNKGIYIKDPKSKIQSNCEKKSMIHIKIKMNKIIFFRSMHVLGE
jgi:hypothetical protein